MALTGVAAVLRTVGILMLVMVAVEYFLLDLFLLPPVIIAAVLIGLSFAFSYFPRTIAVVGLVLSVLATISAAFSTRWALTPLVRKRSGRKLGSRFGKAKGFDAWLETRAEAELEDHRQCALQSGAIEVPGYLVAGEPFVGRANLPVIRPLLTGRVIPRRLALLVANRWSR